MLVTSSLMALSSVVLGATATEGGKVEPSAVVRSFHEALASGERAGALARLDPGVVIFEQGEAEMSRDEYVAHHLDADIEFSRATPEGNRILDTYRRSVTGSHGITNV